MINLQSLVLDLPEDIKKYVLYGDFLRANKLIDVYEKRNITKALEERLEYERYVMKIIKNQYIYTFDEAVKMCSEKLKDFKEEELFKFIEDRLADFVYIDGKIMFYRRFLDTILAICPNIDSRLKENKNIEEAKRKKEFFKNVTREIIEKGHKTYFIHIKTGIKLSKDVVRKGEKIRVHLPIPKPCIQISDINIIASNPKAKFIAPQDSNQRTIYFEKEVKGEEEFTVEYSYKNSIEYNKLEPGKAEKGQPDFYTEELPPQIVFTPYLKDLAKSIVGSEVNPIVKARKIYDYITKNVQYSFVRPYASIVNIPEYAAYNLKGDCGVQALLFITLCRICKVPARWQSGLYVNPYSIGCHDWAQFYIAPYGWVFADLSFGGSAYRNGNLERWNFYFGNLDPFRMVANSDFQGDFTPNKNFFRIDPYDNQVGEAEYLDKPLEAKDFEVIKTIVDIHEVED
ncbi:transglutaminase-like domain-containing protein [Haloimpatiens sp. FM7315]|uniref:transglutaminase-like domain-containing protein n=1 Tax=Haloimpatiens sp. FM7315 TaxID=3298609 RepID=UPI00370A9934